MCHWSSLLYKKINAHSGRSSQRTVAHENENQLFPIVTKYYIRNQWDVVPIENVGSHFSWATARGVQIPHCTYQWKLNASHASWVNMIILGVYWKASPMRTGLHKVYDGATWTVVSRTYCDRGVQVESMPTVLASPSKNCTRGPIQGSNIQSRHLT